MFLPKPTACWLVFVIAIDEQGRIVRSLHDTSGHHLRMITSAKSRRPASLRQPGKRPDAAWRSSRNEMKARRKRRQATLDKRSEG